MLRRAFRPRAPLASKPRVSDHRGRDGQPNGRQDDHPAGRKRAGRLRGDGSTAVPELRGVEPRDVGHPDRDAGRDPGHVTLRLRVERGDGDRWQRRLARAGGPEPVDEGVRRRVGDGQVGPGAPSQADRQPLEPGQVGCAVDPTRGGSTNRDPELQRLARTDRTRLALASTSNAPTPPRNSPGRPAVGRLRTVRVSGGLAPRRSPSRAGIEGIVNVPARRGINRYRDRNRLRSKTASPIPLTLIGLNVRRNEPHVRARDAGRVSCGRSRSATTLTDRSID